MVRFRRKLPEAIGNPEKKITNRSLEMLNMIKQMGGMVEYQELALRMDTTSGEVEEECFLLTRAGWLVYNTDGYGREFLSTREYDLSGFKRRRGLLDAGDNQEYLSLLQSAKRGVADDKQDSK